ncbi:MAG: Uma2 family endonuclease [Micropepsaceae bacterium]
MEDALRSDRPFQPLRPPPRPIEAADIFYLLEAGLLHQDARFELLDGKVVPLRPKSAAHEGVRLDLIRYLARPWARKFDFIAVHTPTIDELTILEPDFLLFKRTVKFGKAPLNGSDVHLLIEVAEGTAQYELEQKSKKYASFGVAEYWVIEADTRRTHVHRKASREIWHSRDVVPAGKPLAPLCAPKAVLKL